MAKNIHNVWLVRRWWLKTRFMDIANWIYDQEANAPGLYVIGLYPIVQWANAPVKAVAKLKMITEAAERQWEIAWESR